MKNKTKSRLEKMKMFSKESYDDVVNRLINSIEDDEGILNKQTVRELEKSLKEIKSGKYIPHEEVKRKLGL